MNDQSFAELYCAQNRIDPLRYEREVLSRSLYPHARLVAWLILLTNPEVLAADFDFVRSVGELRRFRDFEYEAQEYAHHPGNRGFWRERCFIRVSSRALRRMVRETLHPSLGPEGRDHAASAIPFVKAPPQKESAARKTS
jgi:hypothetical protein